jgi:uncharacterized protein YbjT (DUF2867 family)
VGREVVRRLTETAARPLALVRPGRGEQLLEEGVGHVTADLDRPDTIDAALDGVDRLFLLTRQTGRQLAQEEAVIAAAARAGIGRVVKLSVFRADEQSPLQVARQHGQAERVLAQSGLAATILRPVFFMQNLLAMVHDGAIATAAGDGRVAMVDARDIAAVAVATLTGGGHAGKTYTLTGPEALSFYQVASVLSRQTGRPLRHVRVPPDKVRVALQGRGVAAWYADDMAKLHSMLAVGYEEVVTDDIHRVTGRPPRTLAQFAGDHAGVLTRPPAGS